MVLDKFKGICERKILFRMKKEVDQAEFKGTRTGPNQYIIIIKKRNNQ